MDKVSKGCHFNISGLARKFNIVLCDAEPEYKGYCLDHLPYQYRLDYEHNQVTQEIRQKYLDHIHNGKSIGEAQKLAGISFEAAIAIILVYVHPTNVNKTGQSVEASE